MSFAHTMTILCVEDDPVNRLVLAQLLQALGHEPVGAEGGAEGLQALRETRFDLVMTDLHMPEVSGQALLAAVRAGEAGDPAIPLIAVSADVMSHPPHVYREMGFAGFLAKPITMARLESAIDEVRFGSEAVLLARAATRAYRRAGRIP